MAEKKHSLPPEYLGKGNKRKFNPSEMLVRQVVAAIDQATTIEGLKDYEVAEKLGMTKNSYSRIKNQKGSLNMGSVEAIAEILGYRVEVKLVKKEN